MGIIGASESGKSYLLDVFSGRAKFSGSIEFNSKIQKFLTYCPSKNNLDLSMTPDEMINYLCKIQGYRSEESEFVLFLQNQITGYLLYRFGLIGFRNKQISKLSVDNQKKISLAICTIGNPNIILLDNVTAGLEESSKKMIIKFIQTLKSWNKTVLITSHR
ncbi:ATP-binding cassette sub-family A member 12 [Thelohanellus kitauei]|uniref:ATP-binding cassette sub-family A member 12 n=1 Tax=Thelohanellus kitauei TaxID=669202 RepID=A0A0C2IVT0_THEKT|nr:ATP-binding cassette sub-family A member 12 [Thelohanellus kitauei]